jgi:hypothetical protein
MCAASVLLLAVMSAPSSVFAEEGTAFSGIVTNIQGQRLEIVLDGGEKIMVTTNQAIPEDAIGKRISGWYTPLGDTNLLINPSFNGQ